MLPIVRLSDMKLMMNSENNKPGFNKSLRQDIAAATSWISSETNRRFDWHYQTYWHDARRTINGGDVSGEALILADDLQELHVITNGMTIPLDAIMLEPQRETRFKSKLLITTLGLSWASVNARPVSKSIGISGFWGYGGQFTNNGQTLTAGVNESVTVLPLSDVADLETNDMLRIGNELVRVMSIATLNVTVERAYNGTTSVAHSSGAAIKVYSFDSQVAWCTGELVLWMRAMEASPTLGKQVSGTMQGQISFDSLPKNLRDALTGLRRKTRIRGS